MPTLWRTHREIAFYWSFFFALFVAEAIVVLVYGGRWFSLVGVFGASVCVVAIVTTIETGDDRLGNTLLMWRRRRNREWSERGWRL